MSPNFPNKLSIPVMNHLSGKIYFLKRVDEIEPSDELLEHLVAIGNEYKVYSWIFKEMLKGEPYGLNNANDFFEMGRNGWNENEQFVFMLMTENGEPAACIDIKSSDLDGAEIGYLSSVKHRGVMTNTVIAILNLARDEGYKRLFALVQKGNDESSDVMLRAGFLHNEARSEQCETYNYYETRNA